jgi:hypothetical protein
LDVAKEREMNFVRRRRVLEHYSFERHGG